MITTRGVKMRKFKKTSGYIFRVFSDLFSITPFSCVIICICYAVNAIYPTILTYVMSRLYETAERLNSGNENSEHFFRFIVIFALTYIIKNLFDMLMSTPRGCGLYTKAKYTLDRRIAEKAAYLPYISYEETETYERMERAKDCINSNIPQRIFRNALDVISQIIAFAGTVAILVGFNIWLLPISLITVIPFFIIRFIRGREFYTLKWFQAKKRRKMDYLWGLFIDRKSIKEMRAFQFNHYIYEKWNCLKNEVNREEFDFRKKDARSLFFCDVIRISGILIGIVLCIALIAYDKLTVGQFAACISAFFLVQNMAKDIFVSIASTDSNMKFLADYYGFMDIPSYNKSGMDIHAIDEIYLHNVSFKYPKVNTFALEQVNLHIHAGEKIAVVGENGSGKTTLAKLILNLFEPSSGEILINKIPVSSFDQNSYHDLLSVIPQNFVHYNMTVAENIAISDHRKQLDEPHIREILKYIGLEKYSGKLDTMLGKEFGGEDVSGGEWQKIAIARALYKDSELLVLDEPTSALDPLIENEILGKFIDMAKDKTAIIISHRIGLCKLVDKLVVMKDGKIVGCGSHDELIETNTYYQHLFFEQQKWYE